MSVQTTTDAIESLAISMHSQPGVFALLLGSGVSRSAGVLTGWEVMSDLIRQIAAMRNESCGSDPTQWYRGCFGDEPSYSEILKKLGPTPADRKSILKRYFEPTEEEREQGLKQPSQAHLAIAELVAHGHVKVIITTNFDRLIENAISQAGVEPVVLSTDGDFANAEPLAHMRCCVIKLHGDYLDPDTLNTSEELSDYGDSKLRLLERVFEDYGLVVCGWSADWDQALRESLQSAKRRPYTTFWHLLGTPSTRTNELMNALDARTIAYSDADGLFDRLRHHVVALKEHSMARPDSDELAIATLKRFLVEDRYRIQLADLIKGETNELTTRLNSRPMLSVTSGPEYGRQIAEYILSVEQDTSRLIKLFAIGGYWSRFELTSLWSQSIDSIGSLGSDPRDSNSSALRQYASMLIIYAYGLGAIAAGKVDMLGEVLKSEVPAPFNERKSWFQIFRETVQQFGSDHVFNALTEYQQKPFPYSERMYDVLTSVPDLLPVNRNDFDTLFVRLEILIALGVGHHDDYPDYWTLPGRYAHHKQERDRFLNEIRRSFDMVGDDSPYVQPGLFGSNAKACSESINKLESFAEVLQRNARFRTF